MPGMQKPKEKRYNIGYRKDPHDERDFLYRSKAVQKGSVIDPVTTLTSVDWSIGMTPVKNQGSLGSCVGFAVTAVKEWQEQKEHAQEVNEGKFDHRNNKYYDLSEAWLYWMCKKIDAWPGIEGTSIRYAMKVLNKIGVPCEKAWPYDAKVKGEPKNWAHMIARWSLIGSYSRLTSLEELKDALMNGPVPIGIGVYEEMFLVGKDGIVQYPKNPDFCYGGHAIAACGFSDSEQLVKFKNSWSSSWGQKGYGYLSYNYIRNFLWDAWVAKDLSVTRDLLEGASTLL